MAFLKGLFGKKGTSTAKAGKGKEIASDTVEPGKSAMEGPTDVSLAVAERFLKEGKEEQAFQIYEMLATAVNDVTAQYNVGSLYAQGRGTTQNFLEGAYWFRKVEKTGDEKAGKMVRKCELEYVRQDMKRNAPKNLYEKMQTFVSYVYPEESAEVLVKRDLTVLGLYHMNLKDYVSSAKLLRASAEFCDDGQAQNYLGVLYNAGAGVPKNDLVALYWLDRAADNQYTKALEDKNGIFNAYKKMLTGVEFQEYLTRLADWCETGTADVAKLPEKAAYWKDIGLGEREDCQIRIYIGKNQYFFEFERHERIVEAPQGEPEKFVYQVGNKQFTGDEPTMGEMVEEMMDGKGEYLAVKQDRYGDRFLYETHSFPAFDSSDREWGTYRKYVFLYDGRDIDLVSISGGYRIGHIDVYKKLFVAESAFREYLEKLECPGTVMDSIQWAD